MTPALQPGDYKLRQWVTNPCAGFRSGDWRRFSSWPYQMKFRCFHVYSEGRLLPALYVGQRVADYVHAEFMPEVFNAIAPNLDPA